MRCKFSLQGYSCTHPKKYITHHSGDEHTGTRSVPNALLHAIVFTFYTVQINNVSNKVGRDNSSVQQSSEIQYWLPLRYELTLLDESKELGEEELPSSSLCLKHYGMGNFSFLFLNYRTTYIMRYSRYKISHHFELDQHTQTKLSTVLLDLGLKSLYANSQLMLGRSQRPKCNYRFSL